MKKFIESQLVTKFEAEAEKVNVACTHDLVELAYKVSFSAQAKYLKASLLPDEDSIGLKIPFSKSGHVLYAILRRIAHSKEDSNIPDSFELAYTYDEGETKDIKRFVTISDPEYLNTIHEVARSMGQSMNTTTAVNLIVFSTMDVINSHILECVTTGINEEVELDGVFTLTVQNGENPEDATIILLPGEDMKTIIKSDDIVEVLK